MPHENSYAAVHLGDGALSVFVASTSEVVEQEFRTQISLHGDELRCVLESGGAAGRTEEEFDRIFTAEQFPWAFVDDTHILVGSTAIPTEQVFGAVIEEALYHTGVTRPIDLLEVACPSSWGPRRRAIVRRSALPSAREVLVVDAATAVAQSVGERTPPRAVVAEIGELETSIHALTARVETGTAAEFYDQRGRSIAVGMRDLVLGSEAATAIRGEIVDIAAAQGDTGSIEVFLLDTTRYPPVHDLVLDRVHRVRRLRGPEVVRSMAARVGIDPFAPEAHSDLHLPDRTTASWAAPGYVVDDDVLAYGGPISSRAAAWLDDRYVVPRSARPYGLIGAALVAVLAVVVAGGVLLTQQQPAAIAQPERAIRSVPTSSSESASETTSLFPSSGLTPDTTPPIEFRSAPVRHSFGRVSILLPALWTPRMEPDRLVLYPADGPDRRILLTVADLSPDVTLDEVADDLGAVIAERGDGSNIDLFTRATDYGGRVGISYTETPDDGSIVQWRIFVEGGLQIGLGCQSSPGPEVASFGTDCTHSVSTLEVEPAG